MNLKMYKFEHNVGDLVLVILVGADLILLLAPDFGILNSILFIPDIYSWSALIGGLIMLVYGFNGLYKKL